MSDPDARNTPGATPDGQVQEPVQEPKAEAAPLELPRLEGAARETAAGQLGLLMDVGVEVTAVVGRRELTLEQLMAVGPGVVIDLERQSGEPVELQVNGKTIAHAEVVVVDGRLGARIVSLAQAEPETDADGTEAAEPASPTE